MTDWQSYLDIIREEAAPLSSSSRLLTTITTTETQTTPPTETEASPASLAVEHTLSVEQTVRQGHASVQSVDSVKALPERAAPAHKARTPRVQSLQPAADVAGEMGAPAADVAARVPLASGRRDDGGTPALPARWQEIDPRAYQPRPFGPMETDPDWPGEPDEDEPPPPAEGPAGDSNEGDAPNAGTGTPHPPAVATAGGRVSIRQVDASGGRAIAPPAGDPSPDLEDTCWLCEDEVELYDPSGQAWCSACLEAGKAQGWQDLVNLLPAAWQRREERHRHLAVYAAAHYHQAHRPRIALRWSQPPFHQTLKGADLFRAFAAWLAAPERWKQREAEKLLERLVEHQGLGV